MGGTRRHRAEVGCEGRERGRWQLEENWIFQLSRGGWDLRCAAQAPFPQRTPAPSSGQAGTPGEDGDGGWRRTLCGKERD